MTQKPAQAYQAWAHINYQLKRFVMKYPRMDWGKMEAVVNKLGGMEGVDRFLRGETVIRELSQRWREDLGIVYFSVYSYGLSGMEWIQRLKSKKIQIGGYAESVLLSSDFKSTNGVVTQVAILKNRLFLDTDRITSKIRKFAAKRNLVPPNPEVACLIRESLFNEEMEKMVLSSNIVVMHEPIADLSRTPRLLLVDSDNTGYWLSAYNGKPDLRWNHEFAFAFAVSEANQ